MRVCIGRTKEGRMMVVWSLGGWVIRSSGGGNVQREVIYVGSLMCLCYLSF